MVEVGRTWSFHISISLRLPRLFLVRVFWTITELLFLLYSMVCAFFVDYFVFFLFFFLFFFCLYLSRGKVGYVWCC